MRLVIFITLFLFLELSVTQVTVKQNNILSRKKRFLKFPKGSKLSIGISGIKEILLTVPKGFRTIIECEVAFELPSESHPSYLAMHTRHRREVFDEMSKAIDMNGFNGDACTMRMICEIQNLKPIRRSSLFKKLLRAVFINPSEKKSTECHNTNTFIDCEISLLNILLNHFH